MQMVTLVLVLSSFRGEVAKVGHQVQITGQVMEAEVVDQSLVEVAVQLEADCQEELLYPQSQVMM